MKNEKIIVYMLILGLSVMTMLATIPVSQVSADPFSADVTIDTIALTDDVLYYNYVTVKFSIGNISRGWFYGSSDIYISAE